MSTASRTMSVQACVLMMSYDYNCAGWATRSRCRWIFLPFVLMIFGVGCGRDTSTYHMNDTLARRWVRLGRGRAVVEGGDLGKMGWELHSAPMLGVILV